MNQKIILVTGGNRGIGLGICNALGKEGHIVIMGSRNVTHGQQAKKSLQGEIFVKELAISSERNIQALYESINKSYGKLDVLINNAGIISSKQNIAHLDLKEAREVININFFSAWRMIQVFHSLLEKSEDGRIINLSSGMGAWSDLKNGGYAAYRLSKTALNALTWQAANEIKHLKINAMCPGWVRTDMGGPDAHRSIEQGAATAVWLATADHIPSGKFFRDRKEIPW